MYKRKSFQIIGLLAVLYSSSAMVLAADETVFPTGSFAQSVIYHPAGAGELRTSVPLEIGKPVPNPVSLSAKQAVESYTDRFIALGIALGILGLAFIRKNKRNITPIVTEPKAMELAPSKAIVSYTTSESIQPRAAITVAAEAKTVELTQKPETSVRATGGRNILVPIDFSPNSALAIRLALIWAKPNDRLTVVYACDLENAFPSENLTPYNLTSIHSAFEHVDIETAEHWSRLPWVMVVPFAMEIVQNWALNEFEALKNTLAIDNGIPIDFHVLQGDPVTRIVQISEGISAKLIVLVTHRHTLSQRLITGSHAETLLHVSRIPVIALCEPVKAELSLPQEILITTDFSAESLPVFLILKELLQGVTPNITILTVETAHEHHEKASLLLGALEKEFGLLGFKLRNVKIESGDVEAGILDYVKAHPAQLIAMSSHGRLGFAELIHPSITKAILHDAGIPILVVHDKAMSTTDTVDSLSDFLRIVTG